MEGSKAFSKDFMARHSIPTAAYSVFTTLQDAKAFVEAQKGRVVIKVSGLAAGKGVLLPESLPEAMQGLEDIFVRNVFGDAGKQVVIEERLEGEEVSLLAFTDGYTLIPMPPAQDHKRALDGDRGLNTGGMGAYAPAPVYTPELSEQVLRTILLPTVNGMRRDGFPFVGVLYTGLMLTASGPKVLEYNVRFGDPETQVLLPLLDTEVSDLAQIMLACAERRLDSVPVVFKKAFAATVVMASKGYPEAYEKGIPIKLTGEAPSNVRVFHAGTTLREDGQLVTSGGRVLAVTGVASNLEAALEAAYTQISRISFDGAHYRRDIGHRALRLLSSVTGQKKGLTYSDAGVSIDSGNLLVEQIKPLVKATMRKGADAEIGGFGGLFDLKAIGYTDPILVSGTDGVGTKLKIAQAIGKHDTIGIDLVAMNVNDVLVQGAEPLFFLDYFSSSKLEVIVTRDVVAGICTGCTESGCALVGGETAEMPGIYEPGDYDLAGFVVGAVERTAVLPVMDQIAAGDIVLGLPSSGVHSNGYSLVRRIVSVSGLSYASPCPFSAPKPGQTLGEALLTPTRIYVKALLPVIQAKAVKAMAHITGGGFTDNVPRALPKHLGVHLDAKQWPLLPVFKWLKREGNVADGMRFSLSLTYAKNFNRWIFIDELARTFNCGIGMVLIVSPENLSRVQALLAETGESAYELGRVFNKKTESEPSVKIDNMDVAWN